MGVSARVGSIEALRDFRVALLAFCEEARASLDGVEMDVRRTLDWLEREQFSHWQHELRQRREGVAQAVTELNRAKLARVGGRTPDCIEQREALALARHRLEEAEEKLEKIRRWAHQVDRAVNDYRGPAHRLADLVQGDPPASVGLLDRMIEALDSYTALSPSPGPAAASVATPPSAPPSQGGGPSGTAGEREGLGKAGRP